MVIPYWIERRMAASSLPAHKNARATPLEKRTLRGRTEKEKAGRVKTSSVKKAAQENAWRSRRRQYERDCRGAGRKPATLPKVSLSISYTWGSIGSNALIINDKFIYFPSAQNVL